MHENVKIWKLHHSFGMKGRPTSNEKNDLRKLYILDRYCFEWGMSKGRNELNQKDSEMGDKCVFPIDMHCKGNETHVYYTKLND